MKEVKKVKRVYLDHAAGTPVDKPVLRAVFEAARRDFANPGGLYKESVKSAVILKESRSRAASAIGARPEEVVFTSGGTESNNLAIFGTLDYLAEKTGKSLKNFHAVTSAIEHSSVLEAFRRLEEEGLKVTYLGVSEEGIIDIAELKKSLRPETVIVSAMYANNEIGTIQPIREIAKTIRHFKKNKRPVERGRLGEAYPVFHTDACQAAEYLDINISRLGVDLMSLSGSKVYGPKGIGILFKKKSVGLRQIFYGGKQEFGARPGTENVPAILGMSTALEFSVKNAEKESKRVSALRDYFIKKITKEVPEVILNGSIEKRLPNNINVSFPGIDNEELVIRLDAKGVSCSTKSACKSDDPEVSYVVKALVGRHYPESAVRFTLGRGTKKEDLDYALRALKESISETKKFKF